MEKNVMKKRHVLLLFTYEILFHLFEVQKENDSCGLINIIVTETILVEAKSLKNFLFFFINSCIYRVFLQ